MIGHEGPYVAMDGPMVWVPRTVPYRRAWAVAREAIQDYGQTLHYIGKDEADLLGFTRACLCDEVCEARYSDSSDEETGERPCRVPAWRFEIVEAY